jgi:hypothetical protein
MKRINTRLIKGKYSYGVEELAATCAVHPNTVHRWMKEGLPRIDTIYPYMVYGQHVREFLDNRQKRNKTTLAIDEFYCQTSKIGQLKAVCCACERGISKSISLARLPEIRKHLTLHEPALLLPPDTSLNSETKGVDHHAPI